MIIPICSFTKGCDKDKNELTWTILELQGSIDFESPDMNEQLVGALSYKVNILWSRVSSSCCVTIVLLQCETDGG